MYIQESVHITKKNSKNFHKVTHLCTKTQVKKQNIVRTPRVPLFSLLRTIPLTKGNN